MNCPRCGVGTPADRNSCPACYWELSRPYFNDPLPAAVAVEAPPASASEVLSPAREPNQPSGLNIVEISTEFGRLRPAQSTLWTERLNRTLPQRWRRRRRPPPLNGNAVATLPAEARWATPTRIEYIGMPLSQSSFDFTAAEQEAEQLAARAGAPLWERFRAGLLDAALVLLASGFFFGLFAGLTGPAGWERRDILIYLLAGFILAALYFTLFTLFDGRTPGMQARGLRLLTFEGQPPAWHHRLWRAFGYVVSAGSVLLGFLWAAVDEQRLTWHDRISGTFITDQTEL